MGWIHETTYVKQHNPLVEAANNIEAARRQEANEAFASFEHGENPDLRGLIYSHALGVAVYDDVYPYMVYKKEKGVEDIRSFEELFQIKREIDAANEKEAEAKALTAAYDAGMTFHLAEGIRSVRRKFPEFSDQIGNAEITSDGVNLRSSEKVYDYCAVGEEVIFSLTTSSVRYKYRNKKTGEQIILNTLTGEIRFQRVDVEDNTSSNVENNASSNVRHERVPETITSGPTIKNNPFAALLKK